MQNANVLKQKRSNKIKRGKGESVFMWIMFALFLFYALSVILPFLWMILSSLKTSAEITAIPPSLFPKVPQFSTDF